MRRDGDPSDAQVADLADGLDLIERLESQVERNRRESLRANRRTRVVAGFSVLAFLLLAYRSEVNAGLIWQSQVNSCRGGLAIIKQFNAQQEALAAVERDQASEIGQRRIEAYEQGRIIPLPMCR